MSRTCIQLRPCLAALTIFLSVAAGSPASAQQPAASKGAPTRIRVDRSDQLPLHVYPVSSTALALFRDGGQLNALALKLQADLKADLSAYEIRDRATLKSYYGSLANIALLRGEFGTAASYKDSIRSIEDKPGLKLSGGLIERAMVDAAPGGVLDTARFRLAFRRELASLPYTQVQAELATLKGRLEFQAPNVAEGAVQAEIEPAARNGSISLEYAQRLVAMRVVVDRIGPVRRILIDELDRTIAAHTISKPDIWAARDVTLDNHAGLTPVTIAIWDGGVDLDVFPGHEFTNPGEIPGNGKDDDGNGYVDDVHGIAHDLDGRRATGILTPISLSPAEAAEYRGYLKGILDMQAGLNTPEVAAFKVKVAQIAPADFKSFREKVGEYIVYAHGTHVAGIAVRGDPAARVLVARMTSDEFKLPPRAPSLEMARQQAVELSETIEYFRQHGVRVVNMSWGFYPKIYEQILEANNVGASAEERQKLARQIFDIGATTLHDAIAAAPEILFVAAAGNEDADNKFGEFVPGAFDLPNLITAAAVDQAGDEAAFTSYGHVDVYANGYEVPSRVPGGAVIPLSGTSMAAPQVVNLAAKLLALKPTLTVAELRRAIVESADEKTIGEGKRIRLLNPQAALKRVTQPR